MNAAPALELVVAARETLTPRIALYELRDPAGGELPAFTPGAHLELTLPNGLVRSYSLCNDPRERHRYTTAVLREQDGTGGSAWIHANLQVGDRLRSTAPQNRFEVDEGGDLNLLLAAGIGIAPLLAMAHFFESVGTPFRLWYCTRTRAETAFATELEARFGSRVTFHHTDGDPTRRLDVAALLRVREPGSHVYVCGPPAFIRTVREAAREWPQGTVHFELFGTGREDHDRPENEPFEIRLRRRNLSLHVPADRTILEVLESNGIAVKTVCRDGFCGTCTTGYVTGTVDHRDGVLDEDERTHLIQVCVSRARPGEPLVLDL